MTIAIHYDINDLPNKREPLSHHKLGLSYTRTGYGRRIPTEHMVQMPGQPRWRRVYVAISGNSGTAYVELPGGDWAVITGSPR